MKRIGLLGVLVTAIVSGASAQSAAPVAAPVPPAILNARTVFISNATYLNGPFSGGPMRAYDEFYAGLKSSARFQVVDDPANADIVIELRSVPSESVGVLLGFRVLIYESKTHYVLWTLLHTFPICNTKKKCDKGFDEIIAGLVHDIGALPGQSTANGSQ